MKVRYHIAAVFLLCYGFLSAQTVKTDTAVVKSYGGIQVFYNCKPLHPYFSLGKMDGKAPVHQISAAFTHYVSEAQYNYPSCTGIIINDVHFDNDHYEVIRTLQPAGYHDTAVFEASIFMCAKPVRPYDVVNTMRLKPDWSSLQSNLVRLYKKASELMVSYDGIIVDDLDFGFSKSDITVFKWKKP
jgi:hypothetical protein